MEALGQSAQQTYNRELLLKIGMTGMSDEESDDDHAGRVIRIVRPAWRSDSLHQENIISTDVYGCLETARNV